MQPCNASVDTTHVVVSVLNLGQRVLPDPVIESGKVDILIKGLSSGEDTFPSAPRRLGDFDRLPVPKHALALVSSVNKKVGRGRVQIPSEAEDTGCQGSVSNEVRSGD